MALILSVSDVKDIQKFIPLWIWAISGFVRRNLRPQVSHTKSPGSSRHAFLIRFGVRPAFPDSSSLFRFGMLDTGNPASCMDFWSAFILGFSGSGTQSSNSRSISSIHPKAFLISIDSSQLCLLGIVIARYSTYCTGIISGIRNYEVQRLILNSTLHIISVSSDAEKSFSWPRCHSAPPIMRLRVC
jgi:hypothetical protein